MLFWGVGGACARRRGCEVEAEPAGTEIGRIGEEAGSFGKGCGRGVADPGTEIWRDEERDGSGRSRKAADIESDTALACMSEGTNLDMICSYSGPKSSEGGPLSLYFATGQGVMFVSSLFVCNMAIGEK